MQFTLSGIFFYPIEFEFLSCRLLINYQEAIRVRVRMAVPDVLLFNHWLDPFPQPLIVSLWHRRFRFAHYELRLTIPVRTSNPASSQPLPLLQHLRPLCVEHCKFQTRTASLFRVPPDINVHVHLTNMWRWGWAHRLLRVFHFTVTI